MRGKAWYVVRGCGLAALLLWRFRKPLTAGPIGIIRRAEVPTAGQPLGPVAAGPNSTMGLRAEVPKAARPTTSTQRRRRTRSGCEPGQKRLWSAQCCVAYDCVHTQCADILFDILSYTADFLEHHNLEYYLTYGTLLGAVRDRDIIPWTADVDIVVPEASSAALRDADPETSPLLQGLTFAKERVRGIPPLLRGCHPAIYNASHKPGKSIRYLDIYAVPWIEAKDPSKSINSSKLFRRDNPQDKYVEIRGRKFPGPVPAEEFLTKFYGKNWTTPDRVHREHGRL